MNILDQIAASGFRTVDLVIVLVYLALLIFLGLGLFLGRTKKGEEKSAIAPAYSFSIYILEK